MARTSSASDTPRLAQCRPARHIRTQEVGNRNASHPVNAIPNYAYGILESQVRIQLIAAGFDPTIGFLHSGRGGRADFVLDLMEPLRPIVDRKVLEFVQTHTFHPADFTIRSDGVCRLNPEMAKRVVQMCIGLRQEPRFPFRSPKVSYGCDAATVRIG